MHDCGGAEIGKEGAEEGPAASSANVQRFGTRVGSGGNGLAIRRRETVWNMMWIRLQSKSEEYDHVRQTVYSYYFLASSF